MNEVSNVTPTRPTLISAEDAATLRDARIILYRLASDIRDAGVDALRADREGWVQPNAMGYGMMSFAAEAAKDAVFDFLNVAQTYGQETVDLSFTDAS